MIEITAAVCLKIVVPPAEYRPVARMPRCTTADAFSGIHIRNELRTGVILAEDINILKK